MSQIIPIYIPTFINDQNYNPARVLPRLFFFNGMVDCETYYFESGSSVNSGVVKAQPQFPYFDHYNVVTGSFPTTGSRSLLFNNEQPVYGEQPNGTLFGEYWNDYVSLLYNPKTRLITAKAIIPLADYFDMELNDIVNWRGNYYHLRAINDYNLKTGECSIQLLGPIIADTFGGINPFTTTTTTTIAPATARVRLSEWNESPTAFFDLNVEVDNYWYYFSGDFTQSVQPSTSDVVMDINENSGFNTWGPYTTASALLRITDNGSEIYNTSTTYYSGSTGQLYVSTSLTYQSGHEYTITASNAPVTTTTTTTTTTTAAPSATLDWSYSETGGADGQMVLYVNGSPIETRTSTANGTYTVYVGDTIYVVMDIFTPCGSPDTYANVYTSGIIVDANCANNSAVSLTTGTYTVVSGDIGTTLNLDTFASCDGGCI